MKVEPIHDFDRIRIRKDKYPEIFNYGSWRVYKWRGYCPYGCRNESLYFKILLDWAVRHPQNCGYWLMKDIELPEVPC